MPIDKRDVTFRSGETFAAAWLLPPLGQPAAPEPAVTRAERGQAMTPTHRPLPCRQPPKARPSGPLERRIDGGRGAIQLEVSMDDPSV
jgi:hypothetical protein